MSDRDLAEQVERILQASERTTDVFLDQGRVVEARAAIVQAQRALRDVGRRVGDEQRQVRESFSAERLKADRAGRPAGAMTAYNGMRQVTDAARRDPGVKDWEPEIRQFAGDLSHSWWSSRSGTTQPWGLGKWGRRRRRRKALRWIWPRWRARL